MTTPVLDWPALNSLVWLRLACCGAEHPTRIEDFDGDHCVIAAPSSPHASAVNPSVADDGLFLGWVQGKGALELPVDLVTTNEDPIPTWTVQAAGPTVETQRRSFVRIEMDIDVSLYMLEGGAPTVARLLDISEGGLRCRVDHWATDPGDKVFSTQVSLETRDYFLRSQIVWRGPATGDGHRELGICFLEVEPSVSDRIRAYIFAAQLAERRKHLQ